MAEKRRIGVYDLGHNEEEVEGELNSKNLDTSWKEWLKEDLARYWFVSIALTIDVLVVLEVLDVISGSGVLVFAIFPAFVIPFEVYIYTHLWGKNGVLISEK